MSAERDFFVVWSVAVTLIDVASVVADVIMMALESLVLDIVAAAVGLIAQLIVPTLFTTSTVTISPLERNSGIDFQDNKSAEELLLEELF